MSLGPVPTRVSLTQKGEDTSATWRAWFESLYAWVAPLGNNGATSARPVSSAAVPLYIGQNYFDATLGKPVWIKSLNPTVWVDATGAPV
jgi:hypothetical protein